MKSKTVKNSVAAVGCAAALTALFGVAHAQQQVNVVQRGGEDFHTVADGDTLYDLSGQYFGDVYEWPRLWSFNPHITNPHWIYPGDIVYLKASDPADEPSTGDGSKGPTRIQSSYNQRTEIHMAVGGFIAPEEIKYVGRIVASPKQANMLVEYDTAWVGFGDESYTAEERDDLPEEDIVTIKNPSQEPSVGTTYAIVRPVGTVRDAANEDRVLGYKYMMLGSLKLTELSEKYLHTAEIAQSWYEIQRGDLLVPYEQQLKRVQIIQADRNLVAEIVGTVEPQTVLGEFHYVYVNKGADDGLRAGNRFYSFQRREGLDYDYQRQGPANPEIPFQRIGQVLLLDVRKNYSTGVIIDSSREMSVGDRLEMYEGY